MRGPWMIWIKWWLKESKVWANMLLYQLLKPKVSQLFLKQSVLFQCWTIIKWLFKYHLPLISIFSRRNQLQWSFLHNHGTTLFVCSCTNSCNMLWNYPRFMPFILALDTLTLLKMAKTLRSEFNMNIQYHELP